MPLQHPRLSALAAPFFVPVPPFFSFFKNSLSTLGILLLNITKYNLSLKPTNQAGESSALQCMNPHPTKEIHRFVLSYITGKQRLKLK